MILILIITIILVVLLGFVISIHIDNINRANKLKYSMSFYESLNLAGIPVVTFKQGENKFNFVLDTGAFSSVIDKNALPYFRHTELSETATCYDVGGKKVTLNSISADIEYKNTIFKETFRVLDMSASFATLKKDSGVTVHGLLSSAFFEKYRYIIDYKLHLAYPNK